MSLADDLRNGRRHLDAGQYDAALHWYETVLGRSPDQPAAMLGAGAALNALGRASEALAMFEKLERSDAANADVFHGAGEALQALGRIGEARAAFERAVALAPRVVHHHYALAQLSRFEPGDPRLAPLEGFAAEIGSLSDPERGELHFALGKAYDELGRTAEAFKHLAAGNVLRRRHVQYDEAGMLTLLGAMASAFTVDAIATLKGGGNPSELPVFVVGMPRSGTTLVEQILASHPGAFGAGELMYLHELLGQGHLGADFPDSMARLKAADFRRFGDFYVTRLRAEAPQAIRIVDKLPANFMLCGLIGCALPNAHIVHVRRDPLDTCFSCYANLFSQNIDYSYDLGELGRYYRAYETLMDHWRRVLPEGAILDVSYEALVADFETEARRIVAYAGLPWNEACLSFHRTRRVVHTLSAAQVREPIYARSVGRAGAYASYLAPLRRALAGEG